MRLLIQTLAICLALSVCLAAPSHHHEQVKDEQVAGADGHSKHDHEHPKNGHSEHKNGHAEHKNGHSEQDQIEREQCSHVHLDAITEEEDGDLFAFRGHHYLSKVGGKYHAGNIDSVFKGLHDDIDAAFAHEGHIHIIKDDKAYVYDITHTPGQPHALRAGYPKSVKDSLGLEGHIDAAFICPNEKIVHVIQGDKAYDVNLAVDPPTHTEAKPIPFKHVDTVTCGPKGVSVVIGDDFYHYESPALFFTARILPPQQAVPRELLGCDHFDRCKELVFDAAIENKEGVHYFFKADHVFKGFHGDGELTNKTFPELDDHLLGHVDAAFRLPSEDSPDHHEHLFFFLDNKVFSYENHKLEQGYPKDISEVFPGIPDHLDAAVECHKPDCPKNAVIFFKGHEIYHFDIDSKAVHEKEFKSMPNCSAAFRYARHYYCLHGHDFSKFDPNTGEVHGKYPKEAREYFMNCPHYGEKTEEEHIEREQCSHVHLDAITEEEDGDLFAFRGHHYLSKVGGKYHAGTIESVFKGLHDDIDAAFAHEGHIHIIKDDKAYVYDITHTPGQPHALRAGYPKSVKDSLGLEGHIDAAFICPNESIAHVIQGDKAYDVNLAVDPPTHTEAKPIPFKHVDTATCGPKGVSIVIDDDFYHYASPTIFYTAKILPPKQDVAKELLGCDHHV